MSPLNAPKARRLSDLERKSLRARQRMGLEETHVKLQVTSPDLSGALELVKGDTGPQGPVGDTGPEGPEGLRGEQGLIGDRGEKGDKGAAGVRGQTGMAGAAGERGAVGSEGKVGSVGQTGAAGTDGIDGVQGSQGVQGTQGVKGDKGTDGAEGETGAAGTTGEAGKRGIAGITGRVGVSGERGPAGLQGSKGDLGVKGAKGDKGDKGDRSESGEIDKDILKKLRKLEEIAHYHRESFPFKKIQYFSGGTGYVDADAIAAVEGEPTLDLTGDVTIATGKSLSVNVINEKDSATGVTIDSVLLKDGLVDGIDVAARDHAKYTDAEAITAVEGEATLDLSGAVAVTGDLTLTAALILSDDGLKDRQGSTRLDVSAAGPFGQRMIISGATSGITLAVQDGTLDIEDSDLKIQDVTLSNVAITGGEVLRVVPNSTNQNAHIQAVPTGTATIATFDMFNDSGAADANRIRFGASGTGLGIEMATGLALDFAIAGSTAFLHLTATEGNFTQHLLIGAAANPATSAILELQTTTGALLLSRMTTTQRDALTAVNGMIIYNTTDNVIQGYENGAWVDI